MEVSPLDMAAAYGTFARGGYYIEPYTFTKIVYKNGLYDSAEDISIIVGYSL